MRPAQQGGMALITALVVAGVAASIAFAVSTRDQVTIRHAQNLLAAGQARAHARGVELWALGLLRADGQGSRYDHYGEPWGTPLGPVEVTGGVVSGRIVDLQGRWNINNLFVPREDRAGADADAGADPDPETDADADTAVGANADAEAGLFGSGAGSGKAASSAGELAGASEGVDPAPADADADADTDADADDGPTLDEDALAVLGCLLQRVGAEAGVAEAIVDWLDPDDEPFSAAGAEDDWYLRQRPPHRAANAPIEDIAELRLVRGMTDELFERLAPHIVAAPGPQSVNVNTASAELLSCLAPATAVPALIAGRPWTDPAEFAKLPGIDAATLPPERVSVVSRLFEIESLVQLDRALMLTRSRVLRGEGGTVVSARRRGWPDG